MNTRALPNARIPRLRWRPADTVLGDYGQLFGVFHEYAYELDYTAR